MNKPWNKLLSKSWDKSRSKSRWTWASRAAFALAAVPGLWQLGLLAFAVFSRVAYPFELEWMEGGLLDHAARLSEGAGIYNEPSVEFIPYLYTPLYPALVALLGKVFGITFALGRVLSVASLVLCVAVVILATQSPREKWRLRQGLLGVLAAGLIAAAYPWLEGWYDIVRGDTVFIAMTLVGLYLLSRWHGESGRRGHARIAAVAALLSLSFFCKQIGVLFVIAGGFNLLLWRRWSLLFTYIGVSAVIGLGGTLVLQTATDGWFWSYVFEGHQNHDFNWDRFTLSFSHMLKRSIAATVIIVVGVLAVGARVASRKQLPKAAGRFLFWLVPYATAVIAGALGWATQWAHFNAYMSAIFVGAVAVATGLVCVTELARSWFPKAGWWLALALPLALSAELVTQRWSPKPFIPTNRDAAAGHRLVNRIAAIEGDVLIPFHPWYGRLAGKETWVHRMGLMDVRFGKRGKKNVVKRFTRAIKEQRFSAVIIDNRGIGFEYSELPRSYRKAELIPGNERPRTFTGNKVVPTSIWVPIGPPPPPPRGARALFDFEKSTDVKDWTITGEAWGPGVRTHSQDRGKNALYGFTGVGYARSSFGTTKTDSKTGEMVSPSFSIDGARLTARLGGGKLEGLRVELRVDGQVVRSASPAGGNQLRPLEWNVGELRGKRATIALIDRETEPRGFLAVDAFWIWDK